MKLLVSRKRQKDYDDMRKIAKRCRKINPHDRGRIGVPVLVIRTSNAQPREFFKGYYLDVADFGAVGLKFADMYLTKAHKVIRTAYNSERVLVLKDEGKD